MQKAKPGYKLVKSLFGKEIEIPEEWEIKKIKDLGNIITGNTPPTSNPKNYGRDYLWASPADIEDKKFIENTSLKLSQKGFEISRIIPKNAILVVCIGSTIGKIGMAHEEMTTNQQINSIICEKDHPEFVYYQLLKNHKVIKNLSNQVAIPILNKTDFGIIKFIMPSNYEEQQKIASILSNVDKLISSYDDTIQTTKKLKQGLMQQLLTKGIDHTKFKKVPWLFGKEIEIPEEWEIKKIKDITTVSVGLVINPSTYFDENGTIPMITGKNVTEKGIVLDNVDCITEKSNELLETTRIWSGDLVTMRVGYPGRTSVVKEENDGMNCASVIITRKSKKIISEFLGFLANSRLISRQVTMHQAGGAQQVVNVGSWKEFLITYPPIDEQQKIASILSSVDDKITELESKKKSLMYLKKGLMQKLLTGQIRVSVSN